MDHLNKFIVVITIGSIMVLGLGTSVGQAQPVTVMERGQGLFEGHCASCHGMNGDGNGPEASGMTPPPTDFRNSAVVNALTDNDFEQAILAGKPETAMLGYGTILSANDVVALIAYLRSLSVSP